MPILKICTKIFWSVHNTIQLMNCYPVDIVVKTHCIIHWIVSYLLDSVICPTRMLGWSHLLTEVSAYFSLHCTYCIILIFNLLLKCYLIRWTWTESLCWKGLYGYQQSSLLHWKNTAVYKGHRKVIYENSSILNSQPSCFSHILIPTIRHHSHLITSCLDHTTGVAS